MERWLSFRTESPVRSILVGVAVTILALTAAQVATLPTIVLDANLLRGDLAGASRGARIAFLIMNFLGMAAGGGAYLWLTGWGWDWIDLHRPSRQDLLWIGGGFALAFVFYFGFNLLVFALELPTAESDVLLIIGEDVGMIVAMIVIVFLFNAPAEEFVFRNIIQKRLYLAFSERVAVVVASVIFAVIHVPVYLILSPGPVATAVVIVFLFGGSLIFGFVYARTHNLIVPIGVHATLNALMLGLYLLSVLAGVDPADPGGLGTFTDVGTAGQHI